MKVRALKKVYVRTEHKIYWPGDEFQLPAEQGKLAAKRGAVEIVEEPKPKTKPPEKEGKE